VLGRRLMSGTYFLRDVSPPYRFCAILQDFCAMLVQQLLKHVA
jgi:hypothetical protein